MHKREGGVRQVSAPVPEGVTPATSGLHVLSEEEVALASQSIRRSTWAAAVQLHSCRPNSLPDDGKFAPDKV